MGIRNCCNTPFKKICKEIHTDTFENLGIINIRNDPRTTPYPSTITVSGMEGTISKVTVRLFNITHGSPDHIDMLLVHPNGLTNTIIMSDAGGSFPIAETTLNFDDDAENFLPNAGQIVEGIYKPTNYGSIENFPNAPATDGVVALSNFNGLTPNGTWRLFVLDDAGPLDGSIDGWALSITTTETKKCIFTPL